MEVNRGSSSSSQVIPFSGPSRTVKDKIVSIVEKLGLQNMIKIKEDNTTRITEIADVNQDYNSLSQADLGKLKLETIYQKGSIFSKNAGLFRDKVETLTSVTDNNHKCIDLLTKEAKQQIMARSKQNEKNPKYRVMHIGLIMIGLKDLFRTGTGTKALIMLKDSRWPELRQGIIASMEVDLNEQNSVLYFCPNFTVSLNDMAKYLKLVVKTKGFEGFAGDNLGILIGIVGKMSYNLSDTYKIDISEMKDAVASQGIKLIRGEQIDPQELAGLQWDLDGLLEENNTVIVPQTGSYSAINNTIRFGNYQNRNAPESDSDE